MNRAPNEKQPLAPRVFLGLGLLGGGALAAFGAWGIRYYALPVARQPLHPLYDALRSSGTFGLPFGAIGTALMCLNLTYLIRKHFINASWAGSLRSWMAFHVFTGLLGGGLILLHSAFHTRSTLGALAFAGLAVVVITGLLGRYIYAHVPRSLEGNELERDELRKRLEEHRAVLTAWGIPPALFESKTDEPPEEDKGIFSALLGLVTGNTEMRAEYKTLRNTVLRSDNLRPLAGDILPFAERYCRERQWAARYNELRSLMGSWRFFHRWFAIVMLAAVAAHIVLALNLGNFNLTFKP